MGASQPIGHKRGLHILANVKTIDGTNKGPTRKLIFCKSHKIGRFSRSQSTGLRESVVNAERSNQAKLHQGRSTCIQHGQVTLMRHAMYNSAILHTKEPEQ